MKGGSILHVHVVQKGDTLWKIAKQYGVSFDEVKRLNAHLANPDYIVPGMKIFVPEKKAKTQEMANHPFNNDRPVKKIKEEFTMQPTPAPKPIPQPIEKPTMKPMPQPVPQPMPQPINQHLTMTQMMPPYMGIPYGWIPVPDMDVHLQVNLPPQTPAPTPPPKASPAPQPKASPLPTPPPVPTPPPIPKQPKGWQLEDSSALRAMETSSLHMPNMEPQYQQPPNMEPIYQQPPCGCGAPRMAPHHGMCGCGRPSPCGCGRQQYAQPPHGYYPFPPQTLGETQGQNNAMPQHMMMPQPMSPFMACTPCHMWPAPQGSWGYPQQPRYF